ncbi:MAG: helix-turn-helix domain-containing protein [Pseudomonadota bacterium]
MSVKSSGSVFEVLRELAEASQPISAAELAATLRLPVTSTIRALATLEAANFAKRENGSAKYVMGGAARLLSHAFMSQFPIRDAALPYLQRLSAVSGVSCSLFQRLGWCSLRIAFVAGTTSIINVSVLGESSSLTTGAAGIAILSGARVAFCRQAHAAAPSGSWEDLTAKTRLAKSRGFALEQSRFDQGGHDLAVPLRGDDGQAFAAIVLEGLVLQDGALSLQVPGYLEIIRELQLTIDDDPESFHGHYDHVGPEDIKLGLSPAHHGI